MNAFPIASIREAVDFGVACTFAFAVVAVGGESSNLPRSKGIMHTSESQSRRTYRSSQQDDDGDGADADDEDEKGKEEENDTPICCSCCFSFPACLGDDKLGASRSR